MGASLSAFIIQKKHLRLECGGPLHSCIHSLVAEWLPSKESARVRFPLDASYSFLQYEIHVIKKNSIGRM